MPRLPGPPPATLPLACALLALLASLAPGAAAHPVGVALIWSTLLAASLDVAWRLASRLLPDAPPSLFLFAAALLWQAFVATTVTWSGAVGAFTLPVVAAWLAATGCAAQRAWPARRLGDLLAELRERTFAPLAAGLVLLLLGALAVVALNQVRFTVQDADSMWYHLVMPAEWVRTGSIRPIDVIPSMGIGYPGFRHTLLAFLSLAPRNEHLALLGVLELPLLALAVHVAARSLGAARTVALGAGVYAAATPVVLGSLSTQGNDIALAIQLLAGFVFVRRFLAGGDRRDALLGGLALGALAATKFSGPGYAALLLLVAALEHGLRRLLAWRGLATLAAGSVLLAAPWYVRNVFAFGNPLWPAKLYLGDRVLLDGEFDKAYFATNMLGWNVQPLLDNLDDFVEAHGVLAPLGALGWLLLLVAALRRRIAPRTALAACTLSVLLFVAFLHHPFNAPWFDAGYTHRYLIAWFAASTAVAAAGLSLALPARLPWGALFGAAAVAGLAGVSRLAWPLAAAAVAGALVPAAPRARAALTTALRALTPRRFPLATAWAALAVLAFAVAESRRTSQFDPELGYRDRRSERGWAACMAHVHANVHGARVGLHGSFFFFPLLGEPWSNEVLLADDLIRSPQRSPAARVAAWAEAERLDYLVCCVFRSGRTASNEWTFEPGIGAELLALHPERFEVAFEDQGAYVLRLRAGERR